MCRLFCASFFVSTDNPSINASRIATRVMMGGHDVPIPKIISRYRRSILNCIEIASIVDRLYVYDNSIDNRAAELLFRLRDGLVVKQYQILIPEWAKGIIP